MKRIKIQKKLELNKSTVATLQKGELKSVKGGYLFTHWIIGCKTAPNATE